MNPKQKLKVCYISLLLSAAFFSVMLPGCATRHFGLRNMAVVSRYFDKDIHTVWEAVTKAVAGMPIETKDVERGFLKTGWVKGWSTNKSSGLLMEGVWQERYRLFIEVTGEQVKTYVSIQAQVQEKPPGGSRAYRWERIVSDGTIEQDFLKRIENILDVQ
ncbi:MAG: hypothetical protein CV087_17060 [Candidatus Brocadia sp. WS118]|nr:MAG: hypothetical protein CV087_17060 [Candidatus Brocadia sp. WS118]